jgi:hypothetical protein
MGRRATGSFKISDIDGNVITDGLSCKKIGKIDHRKSTIT